MWATIIDSFVSSNFIIKMHEDVMAVMKKRLAELAKPLADHSPDRSTDQLFLYTVSCNYV